MVGWGLYGIRDTTMQLAAPYDLHIASSLGPSVLFTNHSISREGPGDESKLHVQRKIFNKQEKFNCYVLRLI